MYCRYVNNVPHLDIQRERSFTWHFISRYGDSVFATVEYSHLLTHVSKQTVDHTAHIIIIHMQLADIMGCVADSSESSSAGSGSSSSGSSMSPEAKSSSQSSPWMSKERGKQLNGKAGTAGKHSKKKWVEIHH